VYAATLDFIIFINVYISTGRENKNMFASNDFMHVPTRKPLNGKSLDISVDKPYFAAWQKEKQTDKTPSQSGQPRTTSYHLQIPINTTTFQKNNAIQ
jgi:hypothetical protein